MEKYVYVAMSVSKFGIETPRKAFETRDDAEKYIESMAHEEWFEDEETGEYCIMIDDDGFSWYVQAVERG